MATVHTDEHTNGHGDEHHGHSPYLHHHFETAVQQFESDKLGMWLFLATEILLFGGLFCAYSVYRHNHPDVFVYAHQFLNKVMGGTNTVVLIFSSFTMAWAVRAIQKGQRILCAWLLVITLMCACTFMVIKYIEYSAKIKHGLLWGYHYKPHHEGAEGEAGAAGEGKEGAVPSTSATDPKLVAAAVASTTSQDALTVTAPGVSAPSVPADFTYPGGVKLEPSKIKHAALAPDGLNAAGAPKAEHEIEPKNVQTFFAIYFAMTGLHGIHVLIGMIVITIMLIYVLKGKYNADYWTPVDLVGLYWHIVDLIWIFLFPLLYLISK